MRSVLFLFVFLAACLFHRSAFAQFAGYSECADPGLIKTINRHSRDDQFFGETLRRTVSHLESIGYRWTEGKCYRNGHSLMLVEGFTGPEANEFRRIQIEVSTDHNYRINSVAVTAPLTSMFQWVEGGGATFNNRQADEKATFFTTDFHFGPIFAAVSRDFSFRQNIPLVQRQFREAGGGGVQIQYRLWDTYQNAWLADQARKIEIIIQGRTRPGTGILDAVRLDIRFAATAGHEHFHVESYYTPPARISYQVTGETFHGSYGAVTHEKVASTTTTTTTTDGGAGYYYDDDCYRGGVRVEYREECRVSTRVTSYRPTDYYRHGYHSRDYYDDDYDDYDHYDYAGGNYYSRYPYGASYYYRRGLTGAPSAAY